MRNWLLRVASGLPSAATGVQESVNRVPFCVACCR